MEMVEKELNATLRILFLLVDRSLESLITVEMRLKPNSMGAPQTQEISYSIPKEPIGREFL